MSAPESRIASPLCNLTPKHESVPNNKTRSIAMDNYPTPSDELLNPKPLALNNLKLTLGL